jgi:hypothetical protein
MKDCIPRSAQPLGGGRNRRARVLGGPCQATAAKHGHCITCNILLLPEATRVAIATNQLADAEAYIRDLEDAASRFDSQLWTASASQARGELHAARHSWDEAGTAFRDARAVYDSVGAQYDAARCMTAEARVLRENGGAGGEAEAARLVALGAAGIEH